MTIAKFQGGDAVTMSSREIADLTGKRHPDVKRDIPGAPLPFAMVRSKHADDGAQPYAIWPKADITRRFDRFAGECTFVTPERATHPDIQQGRFKLCLRNPS